MIAHIKAFCALFAPLAQDRGAFELVAAIASDQQKWRSAHHTFGDLRSRSLGSNGPGRTEEYLFLESCLKGIYNIGRFPAPFDPESSYKIIPRALALATVLGIPDEQILAIIRS